MTTTKTTSIELNIPVKDFLSLMEKELNISIPQDAYVSCVVDNKVNAITSINVNYKEPTK